MRMIDADAYMKYCNDAWIPLNIDAVNAQPTIEERKTGRWIKEDIYSNWHDWTIYFCSECGSQFRDLSPRHYCPNCGAKMEAAK